ncbi:hypothetical protein EV648_106237 [Kribbella sp. VKM Ac-2568]|nr:hypothetical protein EV648_106237 [Kribbella sp. VKM Ac-2568]
MAAGASLLIAASAAVSAVTAAVAAPTDDPPVVAVTIDSFNPIAVTPGQPVTIRGQVTNTSDVSLKAPQAIACIDSKRLITRADLAAVPAEDDIPVDEQNSCRRLVDSESTFQELGELAPNAKVNYQFTVPWAEWNLGKRAGAYTVGVVIRATPDQPEDSDRLTVGRVRTLMPVIDPAELPRKVNAAMVVPLRHRPTLLSGNQFANDSLAEAMAPNGALGRLLALGEKQKVTWLVDPAMLDEAARIKQGNYKVVDGNNQTRPGTGQKVVQTWLDAFEASRARNPVVMLPYGDPDVGSLIDAGDPLRSLVGQSRDATEKYNLGGEYPNFDRGLWLENGSASSRNLAAASTGYPGAPNPDDVNLVSSSSWATADRPSLLPTPVYNVTTPEGPVKSVRTVVTDSSLTAGGPDPASADQPLQVRQRFAAETALLAGTGTGTATVVVLPPRDWETKGSATSALVQQGFSLPWITPISIDQVTAAKAQPARPPNTPRSTPGLPSGQLDQIKRLNTATTTFVSLLADREQAPVDLQRALLRVSSYSWREYPDEAQRFLTFEQGSVNSWLGKVHLVNNAVDRGQHREIKVNLSGSKGTFPLSVVNELDWSVRVGVAVKPANRTDLRIAPLRTLVLPAGQKGTFQITASAEQNGLIRANAQVISAEQLPVGKSQELVIQAAQYGSVGWILVGAAIALLFGTSAVRIYRRIRSERRNPTPAGTEADPLHPAPLDPHDLAAAEPTDSVQSGRLDEEPAGVEPSPLGPVQPLRVNPNGGTEVQAGEGDGAPGNGVPGGIEADTSLKEGVGTKDG